MKGNRGAKARRARRAAGQTPREAGAVPFREGISRLYCFLEGRLDKLAKRACRCRGQVPFPIWRWRLSRLPATQVFNHQKLIMMPFLKMSFSNFNFNPSTFTALLMCLSMVDLLLLVAINQPPLSGLEA